MLDDPAIEQRVRVFRNGRSRAIRIPKDFDFEGDEVTIRKEADGRLTVMPDRRERSPAEIMDWLRRQPPLATEDFPTIDDSDMKPLDDIEL